MNNSSHNGIECRSADSSAAVERCDLYIDERDNFDTVRELNDTTTDEISKLPNGLRSVKCKSNSPESYVESSDSMTPDCKFNVSGTAIFPVKVIRADHKETELSLGNQIDMQGIQVELNKEVYERKQFNHDTSNFLNSHSPTKDSHDEKQHEKTVDSGTLSFVAEVLKPPKSSENHGEARKLNERSQVPDVRVGAVLAEEVIQCIKTDLDDKSCTQHQQTAIPCLVSEMSGSHYRKLLANPAACSAISNSATSPKTSKAKCLVANKTSISLDLNDLASAGRGEIVVRRQKLACRRHTISSPRTMSSLNPEMKSLHPPLATVAKERVFEVQKVDAQLNKNACENSTIGEGMWFPQSSRKMKRKIPHTVEETDSCKRCSCKRSKCLKLYCACFAAGIHCVEPCNCQDCFNKPAHEDIVHESRRQIESRKPLAFAPKVIMSSGTPNCGNELNQTPASATYKCSCKKSRCVKKYCECFQGGVGCSPSCRCESCQNSFGQQGIEVIVFEKAKMLKESALEAPKKDNENQAAHEHFNNSIGPQVPLPPCGQSLQSCASLQTDDVDHTAMVENTCNPV